MIYALAMSCGRPADRLLLIPQPPHEHVFDAVVRTVPFEDGTLEVYVARSPGAKDAGPAAFMLEFTGNGTRADDIAGFVAGRWGERPVEAWVMNYPGYGRSTGDARLNKLVPAGVTVFDELKKVAGDRPIFIAGNSMGAATALGVAVQRRPAGIIVQSPPPLRQIVMGDFGWWNLWLLATPVALGVPANLDAIANARKLTVPAVFITGDADTLVRPPMQQRIIDAYAGPLQRIVMPGKGHNDSLDSRAELKQFEDALGWLESQQQKDATAK